MNIKSACLKINDVLAYIVIAFVMLTAIITGATTGIVEGLTFAGIGFIVCSLVFGLWFCLSGTYEESLKQTELLRKLLKDKEN